MPFKLPGAPSPGAKPHELADFAELLAWDRGSVSAREIVRTLNQLADNENNYGCEDDEVENIDSVDDVFLELEKRLRVCGTAYPFQLQIPGSNLVHLTVDPANRRSIIYRYLLLCTRLNMTNNRVHHNLDATELFELLSASVLRTYLGSDRAQTMIFGTSAKGGFAAKVKELCEILNEGGTYRPVDASGSAANDGKLDAIAWVPFGDQNPGKLILFGQSKTGTSWADEITHSRPLDFAKKWFSRGHFWVEPVRTLCVAESLDSDRWASLCIDGGLLMDRCRIVELSHRLDDELFAKIHRWTLKAKTHTDAFSKRSSAARSARSKQKKLLKGNGRARK